MSLPFSILNPELISVSCSILRGVFLNHRLTSLLVTFSSTLKSMTGLNIPLILAHPLRLFLLSETNILDGDSYSPKYPWECRRDLSGCASFRKKNVEEMYWNIIVFKKLQCEVHVLILEIKGWNSFWIILFFFFFFGFGTF